MGLNELRDKLYGKPPCAPAVSPLSRPTAAVYTLLILLGIVTIAFFFYSRRSVPAYDDGSDPLFQPFR